MTTWQPIETAPRDGTVIDLWVDGRRETDASWSFSRNAAGEAIADPAWDGWESPGYRTAGPYPSYIPNQRAATHWMPLSEPPEAP